MREGSKAQLGLNSSRNSSERFICCAVHAQQVKGNQMHAALISGTPMRRRPAPGARGSWGWRCHQMAGPQALAVPLEVAASPSRAAGAAGASAVALLLLPLCRGQARCHHQARCLLLGCWCQLLLLPSPPLQAPPRQQPRLWQQLRRRTEAPQLPAPGCCLAQQSTQAGPRAAAPPAGCHLPRLRCEEGSRRVAVTQATLRHLRVHCTAEDPVWMRACKLSSSPSKLPRCWLPLLPLPPALLPSAARLSRKHARSAQAVHVPHTRANMATPMYSTAGEGVGLSSPAWQYCPSRTWQAAWQAGRCQWQDAASLALTDAADVPAEPAGSGYECARGAGWEGGVGRVAQLRRVGASRSLRKAPAHVSPRLCGSLAALCAHWDAGERRWEARRGAVRERGRRVVSRAVSLVACRARWDACREGTGVRRVN